MIIAGRSVKWSRKQDRLEGEAMKGEQSNQKRIRELVLGREM
jgi:hypothetical protein